MVSYCKISTVDVNIRTPQHIKGHTKAFCQQFIHRKTIYHLNSLYASVEVKIILSIGVQECKNLRDERSRVVCYTIRAPIVVLIQLRGSVKTSGQERVFTHGSLTKNGPGRTIAYRTVLSKGKHAHNFCYPETGGHNHQDFLCTYYCKTYNDIHFQSCLWILACAVKYRHLPPHRLLLGQDHLDSTQNQLQHL